MESCGGYLMKGILVVRTYRGTTVQIQNAKYNFLKKETPDS